MTRKAYITVPGNVWKHLRDLGFKCPNTANSHIQWCIELLKAMYGLCDAPLLWQLRLRYFFVYMLGSFTSHYDDCHYYWKSSPSKLLASGTAHVDDCCMGALA